MPEYIVVCCFQCKLFQGQQLNKQKKFKCKVCGEKQSVRHIFAKSDYPKDIRGVVQELNQKRGEGFEAEKNDQIDDSEDLILPNTKKDIVESESNNVSRWSSFLNTQEPSGLIQEEKEDIQYFTDKSLLYPKDQTLSRKPKKGTEVSRRPIPHKQRREEEKGSNELTRPTPLKKKITSQPHQYLSDEHLFVTDVDLVDDEQVISDITKPVISTNSIWGSFM